MEPNQAAIVVNGLVKRYGAVDAVAGIDLRVERGTTFGFLGPNGAGKSTTIRMLCTLSAPTAGAATVAGFDVVRQRASVRRNIGLVFQDPTVDGYLSGEQNLRFHAELYGLPGSQLAGRLRDVLELVDLWDKRKAKVSTYSGGMRRRLEIARGLLHSPKVLFLDEPTVGLDPQTRVKIWDYLRDLRRREDITIFLTTHYMDEAENCDRIAIIDGGRIVAQGTPAELKASVGLDQVRLQTADDQGAVEILARRFAIAATVVDRSVQFGVADGAAFIPALFAATGPADRLDIRSVQVSQPSLDDVFLSYTGRTIRDDRPADLVRTIATASNR